VSPKNVIIVLVVVIILLGATGGDQSAAAVGNAIGEAVRLVKVAWDAMVNSSA